MWLYYVGIAVVFFATFAMCVQQGLWSNTITAINIFLSGLIAFGSYAPLAKLASDKGMGQFTYLLDFLMIWLLYVVAFVVLHRVLGGRLVEDADAIQNPIDTIGGPVMAAVAGWLMAGVVGASLHASPFPEDCFGGVFLESSRAAMTNPDVVWLNLASRTLSEESLGRAGSKFSQAKYIKDFRKQRAALQTEDSLKVRR